MPTTAAEDRAPPPGFVAPAATLRTLRAVRQSRFLMHLSCPGTVAPNNLRFVDKATAPSSACG
eukprot:12958650-Alexandrium_andersonii.AAC.1